MKNSIAAILFYIFLPLLPAMHAQAQTDPHRAISPGVLERVEIEADAVDAVVELATIDVLYDISFLIMCLIHRGYPESGNLVFNRYMDECDEADGLPLMPFFSTTSRSPMPCGGDTGRWRAG